MHPQPHTTATPPTNKKAKMADQQQAAEPIQCAAGCGFFGNPVTENFCSKCYRDRRQQQDQPQTQAPAAMVGLDQLEKDLAQAQSPAKVAVASPAPAPTEETEDAVSSAKAVAASPKKKKKSRCHVCKTKLGMLGFECKCSGLFCSKHRHADQHECSFDFASHDREQLRKLNPAVVTAKLQEI
eukprot:m.95096 g.95096  ORF g.95096 m.95096 type:complete len:183 (+) comp13039_c0_seq1:206-754(+)